MRIFNGIDPQGGDLTLRNGSLALINRVHRGRLASAGPWSLAELRADEQDFLWLIEWAQALDGERVEKWLYPGARRAAFGSLLLLFACESARRFNSSESEWLGPSHRLFSRESRTHLFVGSEPSWSHLVALVEAAAQLKLRFVGGADITNSNRTIMLQIGFTALDLWGPLKSWFNDTPPPRHVELLLETARGSASFQSFWNLLREHIKTGTVESRFDSEILDSSWVIAAWEKRLRDIGETSLPPPPPPPAIFDELTVQFAAQSIDSAKSSIREALRKLGSRLGDMNKYDEWSLVELKPNTSDYKWLHTWVTQLDFTTYSAITDLSDTFLNPRFGTTKYKEALGLILLFWMAEVGRREADEITLWPRLLNAYSDNNFVRDVIFTGGENPQPTDKVRQLLQEVVTRFELRNCFDIVVGHKLERTVRVQFGITKQGFSNMLTNWLEGGEVTETIRHLREQSAGFSEFWNTLKKVVHGDDDQEALIEQLAASPWILPESLAELPQLYSPV